MVVFPYLTALLRFGTEEWKCVRLTHKIHGHVGIYAILGAKMGVYARERLGTPLRVVSFAGHTPPVSCLNDGLQMGARATLGHGNIEVAPSDRQEVKARFQGPEKSLTLQLKPRYAAQVEADIRHGVEQYGHTPPYWKYVRKLALQYWSQWDREELFEEI